MLFKPIRRIALPRALSAAMEIILMDMVHAINRSPV
jgi:hypothetical protein